MSYDGEESGMEFFCWKHPNYIPELDGVEGDGVLEPPIAYHDSRSFDLAQVQEEVEILLWT
jgi:hypothetical protein